MFIVIYEKDFAGYINDAYDSMGNVSYTYSLRSIYHKDKVSQHSIKRLKRAFKKDVQERAYTAEGWFYTMETNESLLRNWGISIENNVIVDRR